MEKRYKHMILAALTLITFIIPVIQLSIGFKYVVKDGQNANYKCQAASDLPILLAIGGVFALFFLGTAYGFLNMVSSINDQQSDTSGYAPKILFGLVSFIFGAITFIFFILMQMRVYGAYSKNVQSKTQPASNYCESLLIGGALAMIILNYISLLLFIGIVVFVIIDTRRKHLEKQRADMKLAASNDNYRL